MKVICWLIFTIFTWNHAYVTKQFERSYGKYSPKSQCCSVSSRSQMTKQYRVTRALWLRLWFEGVLPIWPIWEFSTLSHVARSKSQLSLGLRPARTILPEKKNKFAIFPWRDLTVCWYRMISLAPEIWPFNESMKRVCPN